MKPRAETFVSAKDIADFAFCPESFRLQLVGTKPSRPAQARIADGVRSHAVWTRAGRREKAGWRPALLFIFAALLIAGVVALALLS